MKPGKIALASVFIAAFAAYFYFDASQYLSFEALRSGAYSHVSAFGFFLAYVAVTALSIPGAAVLTLAGGALFGLSYGILLVSFASTIGATLAFLSARYLFRDAVEKRFGERIARINRGLIKDGAYYLLTLRLMPIVPFFLLNLAMGVTKIGVLTYFFVSQLGMLPATLVYVNAGTQLAEIDSLAGVLSPKILLSFTAIGLMPFVMKALFIKQKYKRPKKFDYNIVAIGAGSAGLVTAYIASAVKAKVALIEKGKMGGDCLNTGCVPSKAIIRAAKIHNLIKRAPEFGIDAEAKVNFPKVMARVKKVIEEIAPHDSVERYTKLGVDCIQGEAKILSPFEVKVNGRVLTTRNIVVASGAGPFVPPIPGLREAEPLTSENIWDLVELPRRLLVLGGGAIGCELAQTFARLGSKITLVERNSRILSKEDEDVSLFIQSVFQREGIDVLTNHQVERVENGFAVCRVNGREVKVPFDKVLVALGRKPKVSGFGLEELGIELTNHGSIAVDEFQRTMSYPNIFVCGDVAGPYQFTHTASHQAWFAAVNALFQPIQFRANYKVIPWCTFTDPEVAHVGLSEIEARGKGISYEMTKYDLADLDRAITEGDAHGFVKVLTMPGKDKILGATIVGARAGDLLAEFVLAMKHGIGLNKILGTIHSYPTFAEANKYAAGAWKKKNAPEFALKILEKFHALRRG